PSVTLEVICLIFLVASRRTALSFAAARRTTVRLVLGSCCERGTYRTSGSSVLTFVMRSGTTPTISTTGGGAGGRLNGIVMRWPVGSPPYAIRRPNDSLTMPTSEIGRAHV